MNLLSDVSSFLLVALAGLFGGVIGLERELADKPAGLRTHIFVAAGSALLVLLAEGAMDFFRQSGKADQIEGDPVRIIQAIIVGISFLGAGTIIHRRESEVEGLTTAASIYLTAAIGIAVGVHRLWLAGEITIFAVVVLIGVSWIERNWLGKSEDVSQPAYLAEDSDE